MFKGWSARTMEAQVQTAYLIAGREYTRMKHGDEGDGWGADKPCHDCYVIRGNSTCWAVMSNGVLHVRGRLPHAGAGMGTSPDCKLFGAGGAG